MAPGTFFGSCGTNLPPQFGQTFPRACSTQATQNVQSYEQIRASSDSGARALLQCSQVGLSSSMGFSIGSYPQWAINGCWNFILLSNFMGAASLGQNRLLFYVKFLLGDRSAIQQ